MIRYSHATSGISPKLPSFLFEHNATRLHQPHATHYSSPHPNAGGGIHDDLKVSFAVRYRTISGNDATGAIMADTTHHTGMKRPHSDATSQQRRKVRRKLQHVQTRPQHVEPAPQDPVFVQGQLLRSIGAALAIVGFDSVKPAALEMFRSHVEECMTLI